jgi:CPA2 family monovalent cation:H+ antiporter-2
MNDAVTLMELGGIILVLGLLGRLAGRISMSPIPLYLLAGVLVGDGGVVPLGASEEFISTGAEIGVILLLLLLGLEYTAAELVTNLRQQAPAGLLNVALNAAPGVAAGLIMDWPAAGIVAMAGITCVSSSGITAKLLSDLGRVGNRETPVVLSLLVLEDLSMAVYLPVLTAMLAGVGVLTGVISVGIALVAVAAAMLVALRLSRPLGRLVFSENSEVLLLIVFGLALLVAGLAQQAQISEAVGAFLVGIALSGRVAATAEQVLTPLRDFFAAVFFVFFGMHIDPTTIPPALLPALALVAVTTVTKVAAGMIAARRAGIALAGQIRAGTVMVSRGEFSIVIAGLAAGSAIVAPGLGALAATYVLLMAIGGPLLARAGDPLGRRALALVAASRERKTHARGRAVADLGPGATAEGALGDAVAESTDQP